MDPGSHLKGAHGDICLSIPITFQKPGREFFWWASTCPIVMHPSIFNRAMPHMGYLFRRPDFYCTSVRPYSQAVGHCLEKRLQFSPKGLICFYFLQSVFSSTLDLSSTNQRALLINWELFTGHGWSESRISSCSFRVSPRERSSLPLLYLFFVAWPLYEPFPFYYRTLLCGAIPIEHSDNTQDMGIWDFKIILCSSVIGVASINVR